MGNEGNNGEKEGEEELGEKKLYRDAEARLSNQPRLYNCEYYNNRSSVFIGQHQQLGTKLCSRPSMHHSSGDTAKLKSGCLSSVS